MSHGSSHIPPESLQSPAWRGVHHGLKWLVFGAVSGIISSLLVVALMSLSASEAVQASPPEGWLKPLATAGAGVALVVSLLQTIIGLCICLTAPPETGARPSAVLAIILVLAGGVAAVVMTSASMIPASIAAQSMRRNYSSTSAYHVRNSSQTALIQQASVAAASSSLMVCSACSLAASIFLACFLMTIGRYLGNGRVVSSASGYLVLLVILITLSILHGLASVLLGAAGRPSRFVVPAGSIGLAVLSAISEYWLLKIMLRIRRSLHIDVKSSHAAAPTPHPLDA